MPKFVIHVGPSKTASTYLQSCLRARSSELRRAGVWYADVWWTHPSEFHHVGLFRALAGLSADDSLPADIVAGFRKLHASDDTTVVISSEGLGGLSREKLSHLQEMVQGSETEIVFYFRRWSDRIPSEWQQKIRSGVTVETLPEVYDRALCSPLRWPINYAELLERIASVFGNQALRLISLSTLIDRRADVFQQFCHEILHLADFMPPSDGAKLNESNSIFDTEVIRALNLLTISRGEQADQKLVRRLSRFGQKPIIKGIMNDLKEAMEPYVTSLVLDDNEAAFDEVYNHLSSTYHAYLLNPSEGGGPFERRAREVRYVRSDYLGQAAVKRSLHRMARVLERIAEQPLKARSL